MLRDDSNLILQKSIFKTQIYDVPKDKKPMTDIRVWNDVELYYDILFKQVSYKERRQVDKNTSKFTRVN